MASSCLVNTSGICGHKYMYGWDYNEKIVKQYFIDHAQDMGRLCAELYLAAPKAYSDFLYGFSKTVWSNQNGISPDRRRPTEEGGNTTGPK